MKLKRTEEEILKEYMACKKYHLKFDAIENSDDASEIANHYGYMIQTFEWLFDFEEEDENNKR